MRVTLTPSSFSAAGMDQYLTCFIINETLAIDAGSLGLGITLAQQEMIRDIFLTHCHIDHVAGLPMLLENVYGCGFPPVMIHAHPDVHASLQSDLFNQRLYPNLDHLNPPFCRYQTLMPNDPVIVNDLQITGVFVEHPVTTYAYRIEATEGAVLIITDTSITPVIDDIIARTPQLRGVFLECAFPNGMEGLAKVSGHLTSAQFLSVAQHVPANVPVFAIHCKARHREIIANELAMSGLPNVQLAMPGQMYHFGEV